MALQKTQRYAAPMRNVQIYRAVAAIARHGSIRSAASALSISPSALNRQILGLEEEIGASLFERFAKGVRLSTAGEVYLRCFRAHLAELERAASQIADLSGVRAGVVRVGVGEELASAFLPAAVASYRRDFPGVRFVAQSIGFAEAGPALAAFDVDLVLAAGAQAGEAVETLHAHEARIVCVGRADGGGALNDQEDRPMRLSNFVERPVFGPTARSGLRNAIDAAFAARKAALDYALTIDRLAVRSLRNEPDAVQFALALDVDAADLAAHGLAMREIASDALRRPVVNVMIARGRALPVAASKFADHLARTLSDFEEAR